MILSKEEINDYFFWDMLKKKVFSMKIKGATHLIERVRSEYAKIIVNAAVLQRVPMYNS